MKSSLKQDKKGIKWNEEVISEHDKERGTREKITEAKTPYNYEDLSGSDSEETKDLDIQSLSTKLEESKRKQDFQQHRRAHYNEFQMSKHPHDQYSDDSPDEQEEARHKEVPLDISDANSYEVRQARGSSEEYSQETKD